MSTDETEPRLPREARRSRAEGRGKGGVIAFLLVSAVPAAAVGWYLWQSPETQQQVTDLFSGSGGRAAKAGICLVVLFLLARVALPAFHATSAALRGVMARIRERGAATRILLFPAHLVVWLLWFGLQILFAVDAVMILATGALLIILMVRIVDPTVFEGLLPEILS